MANKGSIPIFLETSLNTRLVTAVSYEETVASFKRKIEAEHLASFSVIGEIIVRAVKQYREGIMYHLAVSMPVSAVLTGVDETLLLYIDAVTTNYKRNSVQVEPGQTLQDSHCGAHAGETNNDESRKRYWNSFESGSGEDSKRRRRKKAKVHDPSKSASGAVSEPLNTKEIAHEAIWEKMKDISEKNLGPDFDSPQIPGGDPQFISREEKKRKKTKASFMGASTQELSSRENGSQKEKATDAAWEKETSKSGDANFINNAAEELKHDTHSSGMDETVKEKSRKKRKKTKGSSSDIPSEVPPIRGDESEKADDKVHESNQLVEKEINSEIPLKSDNAAEELKHDTYTSGMDKAVKEKSRKKRKKTKGPSSDIPCEVSPIRGYESEKADDKVQEGSRLVDKERNSEISHKSGGGAEADNSVPCMLDKKRQQPEISSPADGAIGFHNQLRQQASMDDSKEESRKDTGFSKEIAHVTGGDPGVFSIEKKIRKKKKAASIEGLVQEARDYKSGPQREKHTILEKETSKEAVDTDLINIIGRDPGVVSAEKRRHAKNKASCTDGMGKKHCTEENGSNKERESNLNLEKGISKEAGDAINSAVGDPGVACKEKIKHKKTKVAAKDASSQELSATKNDSSKERESNLIVEKEASIDAGDAHFSKNAGDVAFPAPNSADPDDLINEIVSGVLADIKERSSGPPDTQNSEDAASHMQFLADVAVDQHKAELAPGVIVKTKKERRKSKKESSNKTETMQNTTNLVTGDSVIAPDEKKSHKTAEANPLPNGIDSRESFVLASSQEDGARNQTLGSNIVEDSANDGNKKKIKEQEAMTLGAKVTIVGSELEANDTIIDSVLQTDASGKKEPQTKIKESLQKDNVAADLTFVDEKSSKSKPKEIGVTDKHGVTSLAEGTTQNAPTTEKVQNSMDNFLTEKQDKEAFAEGSQTKGSAIFDTPAIEKINFLAKPTEQPSDATSPLKETKVKNKVQNNSISKDKSKSHTSLSNDVSKRDDKMKRVADMAVMSDVSTEDDEEVKSRLRKPMLAVRKKTCKSLGEKIDASRKNSAVVSSGTCFDDPASEASTRDESGSANRCSPMAGKRKGRAMMSPSSHRKDEGVAEVDLPMSQINQAKEDGEPELSSDEFILLQKAKVSASQSQAEGHDVLFETQPDHVS